MARAAREIARSFIRTQLLPADLKLSGDVRGTERAEYVDGAAKKFSNVTMFGFSFGSIVLNAFDKELALALVERGFTASEAAHLSKSGKTSLTRCFVKNGALAPFR